MQWITKGSKVSHHCRQEEFAKWLQILSKREEKKNTQLRWGTHQSGDLDSKGNKYFWERNWDHNCDCKLNQEEKKLQKSILNLTPYCFYLPPEEAEKHIPKETNRETFLGIKPNSFLSNCHRKWLNRPSISQETSSTLRLVSREHFSVLNV